MEPIDIRCPKCGWQPDGKPYWQCSCGLMWDTFSTGARCPGCGRVWRDTQCVQHAGGCGGWSPHLDWYEGLDGMIESLKKEIIESWRTVPME